MTPRTQCPDTHGCISRWVQLSNIFPHAPDTLLLQSAVNKAGSAAWACYHQWQLKMCVCGWGVGAVIHRPSRTVFIVSNIKMTLKKRGMLKLINACGRQTAIRFNHKTHDTCDVQRHQMWLSSTFRIRHFSLLYLQELLGCWWKGCKSE